MKMRMLLARFEIPRTHLHLKLVLFSTVLVFGSLAASNANGQQKLSKRYPVAKNVRIELKNISGTITVEAWDRDEVKLTAVLDSPKANLSPRQTGSEVFIVDVMADNRGRDVGDVNFKLQVPVNSSVDLQTMRGQIHVNNIRGDHVRAHVSSEGDIELVGIGARTVYAQNNIGDIFFDGEISKAGSYKFQSSKGNITILIPADSAFNLEATASNKKIALGQFWNNGIKSFGEGRKMVGHVGDGTAQMSVINFQGSITFRRR